MYYYRRLCAVRVIVDIVVIVVVHHQMWNLKSELGGAQVRASIRECRVHSGRSFSFVELTGVAAEGPAALPNAPVDLDALEHIPLLDDGAASLSLSPPLTSIAGGRSLV